MTNSVLMDATVGGDGNTYDDSTSSTTGLDNGGHRVRLIPLFSALIGVAKYVLNTLVPNAAASASAAAASASSALNAPGTNATTTTNITPAAGSISFTLAQTGKAYALGQTVVVSSAANVANYILGKITAFNSGTGAMTLSIPAGSFGGSAFSDGVVALGAGAGVSSVAGLNGVVTAAALKSALAITVADVTDYASDQTTKANAAKSLAIAFAAAL